VAQLALPHSLLTAAGLLGAVLSGCLSDLPSQQEVLTQALPEGTALPPAWAASATPGDVAPDWLATFDDPELHALVAEAIAKNLDLRAGAAQVEIAREQVIVVGAQLLPRIGVQLGAASTVDRDQDRRFDSDKEYVGISWELDLWGRLRAERSSAEEEYEATALDFAFARLSIAATTAKGWYLAIAARELVELAEQDVVVRARFLDLVRLRRAAGKVADLDVAEATGSLAQSESQLAKEQARYAEVRRILELVLGRYPAAELEVAPRFAALPPPVPAGMPSALLERRPDVIAARRQVLSAFRVEEAARLALLPSVTLSLEGGHLSDGLLSLLKLNPWLAQGSIGVDVPIYEGGALVARIEIATAEQEIEVARYGQVLLTAFAEVEQGLTNESLLAARAGYQETAVTNAIDAVRIAEIQYRAGRTDFLSVLQLQTDQIASQAVLIEVQASELTNRIDLHLALGSSFDATQP